MTDQVTSNSSDNNAYMRAALALANKSTPRSTNFGVGAILLNESKNEVIATGYTLELTGNTHAEECCFSKAMDQLMDPMHDRRLSLTDRVVLYSTMEPCNKRASGAFPCVDKIIQTELGSAGCKISKVYVGVQEPDIFVGANEGKKRLEGAHIEYVHVPGFESEILEVATRGHHA